jgi:hypothetical protein
MVSSSLIARPPLANFHYFLNQYKPYPEFESHSLRQLLVQYGSRSSTTPHVCSIISPLVSEMIHCRPLKSAVRLWVDRG